MAINRSTERLTNIVRVSKPLGEIFKRPGAAGNVLQTPVIVID